MLLFRILYLEWQTYRSAGIGLEAMELAHRALVVAEKASFERGPSNGVLGDADRKDPKKAARLAKARAVTDAAIANLMAGLQVDPARHRDAIWTMQRAQRMLADARHEVDRVSAMPRATRSTYVMGAVHDMFDVIPVVREAESILSHVAEDAYPQFADTLVAAGLAADLREYAGRLGSFFTAALTAQKPLADPERLGIAAMRGRLDELRELIRARIRNADPRIATAEDTVERRYFGDDLAFVENVQRASIDRRPYGIDTAQFAAKYVPAMGTIVELRDVLITVAVEGARAAREEAGRVLLLMALVGTVTIGVVSVVIYLLLRSIVQPLLLATRVIVDIAEGRLHTEVPKTKRRDEVGAMLAAIETLKANTLDKMRLENERQRLFDELQQLSTTDYLTGLSNRRAFVATAGAELANARRHGWPFALVIFDIDHFKVVNDRFGHEAGDRVLMQVARIAKDEFREGDIVARYGGEEFVAFAVHCGSEAALALAERVRIAIEASVVALPGGMEIRVTASFGGVVSEHAEDRDLESMLREADRALYRAKESGRNRVIVGDPEHEPVNMSAP